MHEFGDTERKIADALRISQSTVHDVITVDPHWRNPIGEWPPNSPDLNPMDYAVWSILEEKACRKPHPNVESLKKELKKAWKEISLKTLEKIVDSFPKRLKACVDAKGGHFE
jgi:predicted transcriptional regulator